MKYLGEKALHIINAQMLPFTALVEQAVGLAIGAVGTGDQKHILAVAHLESEIDNLQKSVEAWAYQELPLQLPTWGGGDDVRYLAMLVPITLDLERIGTDAADLSYLAQHLNRVRGSALLVAQTDQQQATLHVHEDPPFEKIIRRRMHRLGLKVQQVVRATLQAVVHHDVQAAQRLRAQDLLIKDIEVRISQMRQDLLKEASGPPAYEEEDWSTALQLSALERMAVKMEQIVVHCQDICERLLFIAGSRPECFARSHDERMQHIL